jgi:hypothetical protein
MPEYQIARLEQSLRDLFPAQDLDAAVAGQGQVGAVERPADGNAWLQVTGTHPHLLPVGAGQGGSGEGAGVQQLRVFYAGESDSRGLIAAHEAAKMVSTLLKMLETCKCVCVCARARPVFLPLPPFLSYLLSLPPSLPPLSLSVYLSLSGLACARCCW